MTTAAVSPAVRPGIARRGLEILLRVITAAGLAVDAYVHVDLAGIYGNNPTGKINEGKLFLIEAGVASFAALLVLVTGRRTAYAFAFLVAASAFAAVMLNRYNMHVPTLGFLPNMYDGTWSTKKALSAVAEGVALVAAALGVMVAWSHRKEVVAVSDTR